jgi:hypothetical protein
MKTFKFVSEYEVFVVVVFGWTTLFACVPNVVVVSLGVRIWRPSTNARILESTNAVNVTTVFLYDVTADLICVTEFNMVAIF